MTDHDWESMGEDEHPVWTCSRCDHRIMSPRRPRPGPTDDGFTGSGHVIYLAFSFSSMKDGTGTGGEWRDSHILDDCDEELVKGIHGS